MKHVIAIGLVAALAAACSKDGGDGKGAAPGEDAMIETWRKAGLKVSALTVVDAKPYSAQECKGGTVSDVDVVVCRYDTGEDAKAAEEPAYAAIGPVTGAAIARGSKLLVVADRKKVDPSGKTINTITKTFKN